MAVAYMCEEHFGNVVEHGRALREQTLATDGSWRLQSKAGPGLAPSPVGPHPAKLAPLQKQRRNRRRRLRH